VVDSPFGHFKLEVDLDGGAVRVRSTLDVTRVRISPDEYPRFRAFLGEIDAVLDERLTLAPPESGS
jgi:hypothetical protein